jgi:hypothetical protein
MIRRNSSLSPANTAIKRGLESVHDLVERIMERSAAKRKPPKVAANLCEPVKSVEIHAAGD